MEQNKEYYIISLKWSRGDNVCFWRPNNSGYTEYIDEAGLYPEELVREKSDYYNDGSVTLAVEKSQIKELFKTHTICRWNGDSIVGLQEKLNWVSPEKEVAA